MANKVIKNTIPFYTCIFYVEGKLIVAPYRLFNRPAKYIGEFIYADIYGPVRIFRFVKKE